MTPKPSERGPSLQRPRSQSNPTISQVSRNAPFRLMSMPSFIYKHDSATAEVDPVLSQPQHRQHRTSSRSSRSFRHRQCACQLSCKPGRPMSLCQSKSHCRKKPATYESAVGALIPLLVAGVAVLVVVAGALGGVRQHLVGGLPVVADTPGSAANGG